MKKLIKKIICITLTGLMVMGNTCNTVEAEIIQGKNGTVYISYDKIEEQENKLVLKECFNIKNAKVKFDKKKNLYTVEFKTNNCKKARKLVKDIANKLHGTEIEKLFNEKRTYSIKVIAKMKNGNHSHSYFIKGHKVK